MKFVDEVKIRVEAGKGGDGCLSFRREKFIPRGGPDGGDGGAGGNVYLKAEQSLNTLVEFRYKRFFKARNGQHGMGSLRTGAAGDKLTLLVPVGTVIFDQDTDELIGDLVEPGQELCVAKGGRRGLGNARFKSSINRAPRQTIAGELGESRNLKLELKLLADVGLLGLPNAGKSTLMHVVSNARPKVADYPFTTLYPNLGVVGVEGCQSFVIADIPGLIEGAAEGAGLGVRFLKHLSRTGILLHLVDIAPIAGGDPVEDILQIYQELAKFSAELAGKSRWLVLNKVDVLSPQEVERRKTEIVKRLDWKGPVFCISSIKRTGIELLCYALMKDINASKNTNKL